MNFLLTGNIQKTDVDEEATWNGNPLPATTNIDISADADVRRTVASGSSSLSEAPTNSFVDKLTMEYMMNRTHYKKYLAKTDTNKYQRLN
jgi:hypothetical protein